MGDLPDEEDYFPENCNEVGEAMQDEWYAEDVEMQAAKGELKKLLKVV